jgi:ADP-ribose pyrophosphatase YjhB (NUDIX family)
LSLALSVFRRLPRPLQTAAVRLATPSYTVGCLGLVTDGERLLLVQTSYRKGWRPPGGFLDRGEHPRDAVGRELREELLLDIDFLEPHRVDLDPVLRFVTYLSIGIVAADIPLRPQPPELIAAQWFPLDALPDFVDDRTVRVNDVDLAAISAALG